MRFIILGAGGVGSYFGTKLLSLEHEVLFVARGEHLKAIKQDGLKLSHPKFSFDAKVKAVSFEELHKCDFSKVDSIILSTKSTATQKIAKDLHLTLKNYKTIPHIVSLQNGVENENQLSKYFQKEKIIGAITRKIGAHIVRPGVVEATGNVEVIAGAIKKSEDNTVFLSRFSEILNSVNIICKISNDIQLELWKKLMINNGVNALCALLEIKTGVLMHHEKLSNIVYGLMVETAQAAKYFDIAFCDEDIDEMFDLIKNFNSIKPSMLVDREFKRELELEDICGVVIKYNALQNLDAPYTKTVSTLLEFIYKNEIEQIL